MTEPYRRVLVHADDTSEVLLMSWQPGAVCAPHDHGPSSSGVIHVVRGTFVERRYHFEAGTLAVVAARIVEAPAIVHIEAGVIHDMRAVVGSGEQCQVPLTLHYYTPRISHMRVHDPARRMTYVVPDDHGAWLPASEAAIVAAEPWP